MSQSVFQPVGQKRLTNVAVVRYKKHGIRFEIVCYKNKVVNWRNGVEKDLDEVLQTTAVFSNVSKGILAKREDLMRAFGTDDETKICLIILNEGELQISDKERKMEINTLFRDVAAVLSEKCINPKSRKPYTIGMLERALKDIHFSVDPKRPAKTQAVEALPLLQDRFPIERARMYLKIHVPLSCCQELKSVLKNESGSIEEDDICGSMVVVKCYIDPGSYRVVNKYVQDSASESRMEILSFRETGHGAAFDDSELIEQESNKKHDQEKLSEKTDRALERAVSPLAAKGTVSRFAAEAPELVILYPQGPISLIPTEFAKRQERFIELDALEPGWMVQLQTRGQDAAVDAVFFSPSGEKVGTYAAARRMAMAHRR
eukprot:jgi/Picsp_1/2672/NSC_00902-R1_ribosome maturation protein sbds-like